MEHLARTVFVTLVGSKYAAVVAGGQNVSWLLEQSQALTTARQEIPRGSQGCPPQGSDRLLRDLPPPQPGRP